MGQYHLICNIDKYQFLNPHMFDNGLKLLEFGCGGCGILTGLTVLLSDSNGRGGGDLHLPTTDTKIARLARRIVGSWTGDRIVIAGDYGDVGRWIESVRPEIGDKNLYAYAEDRFEDISVQTLACILLDSYIREQILEGFKHMVERHKQHSNGRPVSYLGFPNFVAAIWQISALIPGMRKEIKAIVSNFAAIANSDKDATAEVKRKLAESYAVSGV